MAMDLENATTAHNIHHFETQGRRLLEDFSRSGWNNYRRSRLEKSFLGLGSINFTPNNRLGRYRGCILFGWLYWAVGPGLVPTLDENTGVDKRIGYSVLIRIGADSTLQPAPISTQAGVEGRDMAAVKSFRKSVNLHEKEPNDQS
ncbi:hypothetical protein BGZ61DRAFT_474686 [Ilyonectria robusta]|uniref:uncharacterized protein n=1 Tax=Ilyonectria robusta TaxID=1079257 RepID=UPI001E8EB9FB|nr:uncharacterized protein BGZ61DRAFT_474686 [Ilyonectria robusta]KAH8734075.1 hypothetical protein BGZ61DRAFT_474686 [Ilyonectria robusta]